MTLNDLLNVDIISTDNDDLGQTEVTQHTIHTGTAPPIKQPAKTCSNS